METQKINFYALESLFLPGGGERKRPQSSRVRFIIYGNLQQWRIAHQMGRTLLSSDSRSANGGSSVDSTESKIYEGRKS